MEEVIATKVVNALMAEPVMAVHPGVALAAEGVGGIPPGVELVVDAFRRRWGGLWVGGRATLTTARLTFRANGVNRVLHEGQVDAELDLRAVLRVDLEPGFLTEIVAVTIPGAVFKLRCWGARDFAAQVDAAVRAARGLR